MKKPTIIVIGSADAIKLGLIRTLGEIDCKVISIHLGKVGSHMIKPIDYYSKHVSSYFFSDRSHLIDLLIQHCTDDKSKPVLFPLDDSSVYLIDKAHHVLEKHFLYANIGKKECGIVELMNKSIQKEKAEEAGLNVAKGWEIPFCDGDYVIPNDIEFPCFVKGELGYEGGKSLQRLCCNYDELRNLLDESLNSNRISFIAEEYLPIDKEIGFMCVSDGNNCIGPAMIEKSEIGKGTTNGVTMGGRMKFLPETDHVAQSIKLFLKNIQYAGISNFDFIESKGKLYFLEINFRYAAYGYGVGSLGVNFPSITVKSLSGEKIESVPISTEKDVFFLNEKIGLYNVLERFISWSKYTKMKKKSDILLVKCKSDPRPYRMFLIAMGLRFIKKKLHF